MEQVDLFIWQLSLQKEESGMYFVLCVAALGVGVFFLVNGVRGLFTGGRRTPSIIVSSIGVLLVVIGLTSVIPLLTSML